MKVGSHPLPSGVSTASIHLPERWVVIRRRVASEKGESTFLGMERLAWGPWLWGQSKGQKRCCHLAGWHGADERAPSVHYSALQLQQGGWETAVPGHSWVVKGRKGPPPPRALGAGQLCTQAPSDKGGKEPPQAVGEEEQAIPPGKEGK